MDEYSIPLSHPDGVLLSMDVRLVKVQPEYFMKNWIMNFTLDFNTVQSKDCSRDCTLLLG